MALNNSLVLETAQENFNYSFISDSIKTIEFLCEFSNGCRISNASIVPVESFEIDFSEFNLRQGEGFQVIEDEKFLTYQIVDK